MFLSLFTLTVQHRCVKGVLHPLSFQVKLNKSQQVKCQFKSFLSLHLATLVAFGAEIIGEFGILVLLFLLAVC